MDIGAWQNPIHATNHHNLATLQNSQLAHDPSDQTTASLTKATTPVLLLK
jgi:hypothetical protein